MLCCILHGTHHFVQRSNVYLRFKEAISKNDFYLECSWRELTLSLRLCQNHPKHLDCPQVAGCSTGHKLLLLDDTKLARTKVTTQITPQIKFLPKFSLMTLLKQNLVISNPLLIQFKFKQSKSNILKAVSHQLFFNQMSREQRKALFAFSLVKRENKGAKWL